MRDASPILTAEAQVLRFASYVWLQKPGTIARACGELLSEWADRAEQDALASKINENGRAG